MAIASYSGIKGGNFEIFTVTLSSTYPAIFTSFFCTRIEQQTVISCHQLVLVNTFIPFSLKAYFLFNHHIRITMTPLALAYQYMSVLLL